jgi:hypothetical protein
MLPTHPGFSVHLIDVFAQRCHCSKMDSGQEPDFDMTSLSTTKSYLREQHLLAYYVLQNALVKSRGGTGD